LITGRVSDILRCNIQTESGKVGHTVPINILETLPVEKRPKSEANNSSEAEAEVKYSLHVNIRFSTNKRK
jgi:hypothetical protein